MRLVLVRVMVPKLVLSVPQPLLSDFQALCPVVPSM